MKKTLLLVSLMIVSIFGYSQTPNTTYGQTGKAPLNKGEKQINFGLGLDTDGLPVYAQLDFAVSPDITVSPMVALTAGSSISYASIGVHSDYHFNRIMDIPSNWDFYAGLNLGFRMFIGASNGTSPLDLGIQVGGRYYWSRDWGVNLEFGGGAGFGGRVGVSRRL
jgi:hypothetical protein